MTASEPAWLRDVDKHLHEIIARLGRIAPTRFLSHQPQTDGTWAGWLLREYTLLPKGAKAVWLFEYRNETTVKLFLGDGQGYFMQIDGFSAESGLNAVSAQEYAQFCARIVDAALPEYRM